MTRVEIDKNIFKLLEGDTRALSRLITQLDDKEKLPYIIQKVYPRRTDSHVIGITGAPGAGKSTISDKLIKLYRKEGKKVAVIAVDPTSPFSHGAILGDRIRLQNHSTDEKVFIRSMASRGHLGGLAPQTNDTITLMSAAGYDIIFLETVGVGQSEVEIIKFADTVCLLLTPSSGDSVQVMKAGIMEIGDVFVINKSDRPGSDKIEAEIELLWQLNDNKKDFKPQIIKTIANKNKGMNKVKLALAEHFQYMKDSGQLVEKRKQRIENEIMNIVHNSLLEKINARYFDEEVIAKIVDKIYNNNTDPFTIAEKIIERISQ
ncbi:MAG: methylmalonyl Co-A mutase-associated GTPase MeaB [Candidatus Cloacimonetes bacterium]|nr:methylmalonyl Co-A mutase-associated GTPase MeaB [Candidatus Cloacimonadota bacterium]MBS3766553.1 methylmalonyl Co-A mutase-associated GTPase MeaB [Candidatus Cloacimonadota bacterium]